MKNKAAKLQTLNVNHMQHKMNSSLIDSRAIIDPSAEIGENVTIGPWTQIGANVKIGDGTLIGSHVVIGCNTKMGKNNKIYSFVSLGEDPQDLSYRGEATFLEIGDGNYIREFVTINRGSTRGTGITRVGNKNCFLAYSHVAHDCVIGNEVQFINHATIAGHVMVDDYAIIGAFSAVHQFCHIGAYSFLSQGAQVSKDVLPYTLMIEVPGRPCGLNTVGLKRRGFSEKTIRGLKRAYQVLYRSSLKLHQIREQLIKMSEETPEIKLILDMMNQSKRGITRG